jgi:hypothetical protein
MSGFSAEWLALREGADHAARNREVLARVTAYLAGHDTLRIVDLGSGTGSNLRGCALALPARRQHWTLVDHDAALMQAARVRFRSWADEARDEGEALLLLKAGKALTIVWRRADLATSTESILGPDIDLVTAAALLDLVSAEWMVRFVASLASHGLPLYAALIYDGREEWAPGHTGDGRVHRAFLAHQRRDKGFGQSAGSDAARVIEKLLAAAGYTVSTGASPWALDSSHVDLVRQLVEGIAAAAVETGGIEAEAAQAWARFRADAARMPRGRALIGHVDLWAHS